MLGNTLRLGILLTTLLSTGAAAPPPGAPGPPGQVATREVPSPGAPPDAGMPSPRAVTFQGPRIAAAPAAGRGRLSISFDGNRRWCTAPDDRVLRPPQTRPPRGRDRLGEVFTFGYQFTIAAIRRGRPGEPIMLYESPVIRTAGWRLAAKIPRGSRGEAPGPSIGGEGIGARTSPNENPASLAPYWEEQYRCVTVGERFEFDLDPGVYDVYMAFDLLLKDGAWVHRSSGHLTDVPIEDDRHTVLDGRVHATSHESRQAELLKAALLPPDPPLDPARP